MSFTIPTGRYPIDVTQLDLDNLEEAILGLAPESLDTLQELAAALGNDPAYFTTVANQVSELNTDVTDVVTALGIAENDTDVGTFVSPTLPDGVTLRAVLEAFASAYDNTKSNLETADSNLSGRLDVLEADPTTQAYVDAQLAALIDSAPAVLDTLNELAAAIGDDADFITTMNTANTLLSNRLDVLEADPTTATAVAAVQSDVDQNELDSDAADAALSGRLDTLEADPTTQSAVDAKLNIANPAATGDLTVDTEARLEFDSNITKLHNDLRGTRLDIGNNITVYPAAAGGRFEIEGGLYIRLSDLIQANNDVDAAASGVIVGGVYYDATGQLHIRVS